jgi:hypothetical protein
MSSFRIAQLITLVGVLVIAVLWLRQIEWPVTPGPPVTKLPKAYAAGSEKYYLACVDHGTEGMAGMAAKKLLHRKGNVEETLTLQVRARKPDVVRDIMLLVLFRMNPEVYREKVDRLSRATYRSAFGWVKTDEVFEGEYCDFYFDGPGEAALALLEHGYLSRQAIEILLESARSFYPADRRRAAAIFRTFDGIPPFDPSPQPKTINETPEKTRAQTNAIERWLRENEHRLEWESGNYVRRR